MRGYRWNRFMAVAMVWILAVSLAACSKSGDSGEMTTNEESREEAVTESGLPPAVAAEIELPENLETMRYPVWALLVSTAIYEKPYFGYEQNATDDNADSFYAPLGVLTNLVEEMTDQGEGQKTENGYYKVSENAFSSYANALFDSFGMQTIEAPELPEDSPYCEIVDDDEYPYAFAPADLSRYQSVITGMVQDEDNYGYELTAELRDVEDHKVLYEASFRMIPSSFEGDQEADIFEYSIAEVADEIDYTGSSDSERIKDSEIFEEGTMGTAEETTEAGPESATAAGNDEVDGNGEDPDLPIRDSEDQIDESQAADVARDYTGNDDVSYEGKENLEGQDYYRYTYSDDEGNSKDVLVPSDGSEPISGNKNDDGTWSFDQ